MLLYPWVFAHARRLAAINVCTCIQATTYLCPTSGGLLEAKHPNTGVVTFIEPYTGSSVIILFLLLVPMYPSDKKSSEHQFLPIQLMALLCSPTVPLDTALMSELESSLVLSKVAPACTLYIIFSVVAPESLPPL